MEKIQKVKDHKPVEVSENVIQNRKRRINKSKTRIKTDKYQTKQQVVEVREEEKEEVLAKILIIMN